jgi:hypothetical protein
MATWIFVFQFAVKYQPDKRPIDVQRWTDEMTATLDEIVEEHTLDEELTARLRQSRQAFVFEVPGDPPEDVWDMLAATEAFLARERDGIVVADEGIYDAELRLLTMKLQERGGWHGGNKVEQNGAVTDGLEAAVHPLGGSIGDWQELAWGRL